MFGYFIFLILFGIIPFSAGAYLDPGTGSYLFQMLIAGALGGLFVIKTYWRKASLFVRSRFKKTPQGDGKGNEHGTTPPSAS